jgi:mannose-6-phosphate isomerase-like protein (cupin superfamily)
MTEAIKIAEKLAMFSDQWAPKIVAQMNDYHVKLAKIQGEFVWHSHEETDELFLVVDGKLRIDFRDGYVELEEGELCIVQKGIEHKPSAERECSIMLIEPIGTVNTGDVGGERTKEAEWL